MSATLQPALTHAAPGAGPAPGSASARDTAGRRRRRLVADLAGPGIVVGLALALLVAAGIVTFHGNPTGFVRFGRAFTAVIGPPRGAIVYAHAGNDGQYFWALAQDPLLLHAHTLTAFATQSFRLQRVAYPALAYLLAAGDPGLIPWTLLAINVAVVLGATLAFAAYARRKGWSPWWALAIGLLPGLSIAVVADFSDAVAMTAMLGGMIAWREGRRRSAAALLAVAVLAREPMMLAVAAIALQAGLDARGAVAGVRPRVRHAWRTAGPAVIVPTVAFVAWQVYIAVRIARSTSAPGTAFSTPFAAIATEAGHALHNASPVNGAWDLLYLALMLAGIGVAAAMVLRRRSAPAIAALLFGLMLLVLTFGYAWSYTRLSAPMFACLLLAGLERRHRGGLGICAVVAALGALVPLAIG